MRNAAGSDWRKQQQLNFIHNNQLHLKPVPREVANQALRANIELVVLPPRGDV